MSDIYKVAEEKMNKSVNAMLNEYAAIRAGRANPAVLDRVEVEYYGAPTPLNQMAAISVPDARTLVVQPWDKSSLKDIERGILTADIGINPQNDGSVIRLVFPPLTEERRREIGKNIFKLAEDCKIAIRSIRRDAMDKLKDQKKKAEITEDDLKDEEMKMQEMTDKFCKEIDGLAAKKDKEIMEV